MYFSCTEFLMPVLRRSVGPLGFARRPGRSGDAFPSARLNARDGPRDRVGLRRRRQRGGHEALAARTPRRSGTSAADRMPRRTRALRRTGVRSSRGGCVARGCGCGCGGRCLLSNVRTRAPPPSLRWRTRGGLDESAGAARVRQRELLLVVRLLVLLWCLVVLMVGGVAVAGDART